ncbi:glutathione S-transferase-like protein [Diaporthe sp. PMI_573]|nr:glutathione S-transferase-like protein [Diaporthaceae sp. PMI_573]
MGSFGTIYSYPNNWRVSRAQVVAAINGLEIDVPEFQMGQTNKTPEFLYKFPLGKVPAFEGADGFTLSEGAAIATYLAGSGPCAEQLLGSDLKTKAKIAEWSLFTETELVSHATPALLMMIKLVPFDGARYDFSASAFERALQKVEAAVKGDKKYLVGEQLTLADLTVAAALFWASGFLLDAEMRKTAPATIEYLKGIAATSEFAKVFGEYKPCETRVKGGA